MENRNRLCVMQSTHYTHTNIIRVTKTPPNMIRRCKH